MEDQEEKEYNPPKWAGRVLRWFCSDYYANEILGDLYETFQIRAKRNGLFKARLYYILEVILFFKPSIIKKSKKGSPSSNRKVNNIWPIMFKYHLKLAYRNTVKHKGYSAINISGLAIGIACCIFILLFVQSEFKFDQFHEKKGRIYRVEVDRQYPNHLAKYGAIQPAVAQTMVHDYPEVKQATRLRSITLANRSVLVKFEDKWFDERQILFADPNFFDVFTFSLAKGNSSTALIEPNSVIITTQTAEKYFGKENPLGKTLTIGNRGDYMVTGIIDKVPSNSHFQFDFLASLVTLEPSQNLLAGGGWLGFSHFTYIVVKEKTDPRSLEAKFPKMVQANLGPMIERKLGVNYEGYLAAGNLYTYMLKPLTDIHLYSHREQELGNNGDITYVSMFSTLAFIVLLLGCINFMNLTTARSIVRSKEVGIRKVLGSQRKLLIQQFMTEALLQSWIAVSLGLLLAILLLPQFNTLAGKSLLPEDLLTINFALTILGLIIIVGLFSGSYPAFYLSSFQPASILKGSFANSRKGHILRDGLVVAQFLISMVLIVGAVVVFRQLQFMRQKELGFDKDQVIIIEKADLLGERLETFKNEIIYHSDIVNSTGLSNVPGQPFGSGASFTVHGIIENAGLRSAAFKAEEGFIETLGLNLTSGRGFSSKIASDSMAVILNESAKKAFGKVDPIGQTLNWAVDDKKIYTIVGVIKDFHFESLRNNFRPLLIFGPGGFVGNVNLLAIRINSNDFGSVINSLETIWQKFTPEYPFSYYFLDDKINSLYHNEDRTARLFGIFSGLAIIIACLGLFALAAFVMEKRTKEIAIRKVLGASISNLLILVMNKFTKLVMIAIIIGTPVAYYGMNKWLEDFAFRTELSAWIFIIIGLLMLTITYLTVSYHAIRAARSNPVKSLTVE